MTTTRTARITLGASPAKSSIEVDGHDISHSVRGVRIDASVHDLPRLELDLILLDTVVEGEFVVQLPPATRQALIDLGWTEPSGGAA